MVAPVQLGYKGQCMGAEKAGLPDAVCAFIRIIMAQWCAPWRRQQGGRRNSLLAGRAAASGPSPKNKIRMIETPRRIWDIDAA